MKPARLRPRAKQDLSDTAVYYAEQVGRALALDIDAADRAAREALAKAQAIEDAVYDLKAVNPREKKATDTRTPAQLLEAIAAKGREVDAALARLRSLL